MVRGGLRGGPRGRGGGGGGGGGDGGTPEVDIVINNVVCSFSVRCHLNLRDIALRGLNVEYRKENGVSQALAIVE